MSDEVSMTQVQNVLERLVSERKALKLGLDLVTKLNGIEQSIFEREQFFEALKLRIASAQADAENLEEHVQSTRKACDDACAERERLSDELVKNAQRELEEVRDNILQLKAAAEESLANNRAAQAEEIKQHQATIKDLKLQIAELESNLAKLQKQARALAGV